jgi:hypothetical protein
MSDSNVNAAASSVGSSGTPAQAVGTQLGRTGAAKAVGGGLEAGTTDFGSSTTPMSGGAGGAGSGAARTTGSGSISGTGADGGPADAPGMVGAAGLSVSVTGRRMDPDGGGTTGAAAVSGAGGAPPASQVTPSTQEGATGRHPWPAGATNDYAAAPNLITPGPADVGDEQDATHGVADQMTKPTIDARAAIERAAK